MTSTRTVISTAEAPAAIGPYSQGIAIDNQAGRRLLFCSGQVALLPETGQLVAGDVTVQTEQVMRNIGAVLRAAGADYGDIVKTTIFLANMGDFATVNQIYARYFTSAPPARSTVQVAGLPRNALVEIEVIAAVP